MMKVLLQLDKMCERREKIIVEHQSKAIKESLSEKHNTRKAFQHGNLVESQWKKKLNYNKLNHLFFKELKYQAKIRNISVNKTFRLFEVIKYKKSK